MLPSCRRQTLMSPCSYGGLWGFVSLSPVYAYMYFWSHIHLFLPVNVGQCAVVSDANFVISGNEGVSSHAVVNFLHGGQSMSSCVQFIHYYIDLVGIALCPTWSLPPLAVPLLPLFVACEEASASCLHYVYRATYIESGAVVGTIVFLTR